MTRRGLFLSLFGGLMAARFGDAWAAGRKGARLGYGPDPRQTVEIYALQDATGRPLLMLFDDGRGEGRRIARRGSAVIRRGWAFWGWGRARTSP